MTFAEKIIPIHNIILEEYLFDSLIGVGDLQSRLQEVLVLLFRGYGVETKVFDNGVVINTEVVISLDGDIVSTYNRSDYWETLRGKYDY